MPPIRRTVDGMLKELSETLPVERSRKPTLFTSLSPILQPVLSIRPSPLVDQLLGVDVIAVTRTLVAAEVNILWASDPVPSLEVHRYEGLYVSHDSAAPKQFSLTTLLQKGAATVIFANGRELRQDVGAGARINLLSSNPTNDPTARDWKGSPYDLYPGMSFQIFNNEALDLLSVLTLHAYRLRMRGPEAVGAEDVSSEITQTVS